ncbi:MAG: S9 family peptidase [Rhodospirillales bacterium]|nr:S9 family peptidase [Rhodospirillales bacterium]
MPVATDAWVRISAATSPSFSKDGQRLFHLRGAGLAQVWVMDLDGGNARQLSFHDEKVAFLRRCPADDRLIWGVDAGGDERQQFVLLESGAAPRALTAAPEVIHDFGAWSADGARIAFAANDRDERFHDVSLLDLASGGRVRLMEGPGTVSVTNWNAELNLLVVIEDFSSTDQRLWLLDAATGAARMLPRPSATRYAATRFVGGELLGLTDHGGAAFMRLCRIDTNTGDVAPIHAPAGRDVEAWAMSADGRLLATVENDRGYAVLRVGPPDGERPHIGGLPEGIAGDLAWSPDGTRLAFTAQGPTAPAGIWLWQDGVARAVFRPDPLAEAGIDPAAFIAPTLVEWTSFDGARIPGWFATPRTAPPPGGFPAVVWVHGGPAAQTRANFRADIQMLLDRGFAVLMPNIRGSTGYGRAYMEADEVEKRPDAMEDLAAGRAWLAARPGIDAARIGIMGQSYGGWVVLAAVTMQPELWKAAVDYYGIADFVTLLERTGPWRRDHRAREYGFPETEAGLFRRISPIHQVDRVAAPLLVLHGDRDPRVPMHESDQFVSAMELRQKPVRYERFAYAGHGFIRPEHRVRVYAAVAEHFTLHL